MVLPPLAHLSFAAGLGLFFLLFLGFCDLASRDVQSFFSCIMRLKGNQLPLTKKEVCG
jgi:hypothetical protein